MKKACTVLLPALLAFFSLVACYDESDAPSAEPGSTVGGVPQETWTTYHSTTWEQRTELQQKLSARLDQAREEIDRLRSAIEAKGEQAGDAMEKTLQDLQAKAKDAQQRLSELGQVASDRWDRARDDLVDSLHDLHESASHALEDLKD